MKIKRQKPKHCNHWFNTVTQCLLLDCSIFGSSITVHTNKKMNIRRNEPVTAFLCPVRFLTWPKSLNFQTRITESLPPVTTYLSFAEIAMQKICPWWHFSLPFWCFIVATFLPSSKSSEEWKFDATRSFNIFKNYFALMKWKTLRNYQFEFKAREGDVFAL